MLRSVTTRPGRFESRPTRLVAWMYSAAVLGWPTAVMSPSLWMSRPTEIMFVAIAQSTELPVGDGLVRYGFPSRRRTSATLFVETLEASSTTSEMRERSLKRLVDSPNRFLIPMLLIVFCTSSSRIRLAPPSSRSELK